MSYGLTFKEVSQVLTPLVEETTWGTRTTCTNRPEYGLERLEIRPRAALPSAYLDRRGAYYVERGEVTALTRASDGHPSYERLSKGAVLPVALGVVHGFFGGEGDSVVYFFSDRSVGHRRLSETQAEAERAWQARSREPAGNAQGRTSDFREKYWGTIETIVDDDFAGKRIFLKEGSQSSLEFHTKKVESYFLDYGRVRVGLRTGRAENRSIILSAGQSFDVVPGLMHMRMALADSLIIEVSTRDTDADSHLVEDGMKYKHTDVTE